MRVLTVGNRYPPWSLGGYEVTWASTVQALRAAGHRVGVLTTEPDPTDMPGHDPDVRRALRWYWRAHAFPERGWRECLALERHNADVLAGELRAQRPEAVMWWAMGGMSLGLLEQVRRAGVPALAVVGDDWINYGSQVDGWTRRWRRVPAPLAAVAARSIGLPVRLELDRAAQWSFNSQHTLAVARAAGWRLAGATVDHPGVAVDKLARVPPRPWGWRLLCCGRIDPRKGTDLAIHALARLPESAVLTIHGSGHPHYLAELTALAQRVGVAGRVSFGSSAPEAVAGAYAQADALLFPVRWHEPWGLVPLEAMAAGRPVVATTPGGGSAEYLRPDRNCLSFAPEDAAGLAAAVTRLAGDEHLRAGLVAAGRETASRFDESSFHAALAERLAQTIRIGALR